MKQRQESVPEQSWANRSGATRLLLPLLTVLVLQAQSQWTHYQLLSNTRAVEDPLLQSCLLLSIWAFLTVLPRTLSALSGFLLSFGLTLVWLFDANYYRFFRELPSWQLLPIWRQAGKASESLSSVLKPSDSLLLAGPLLLGLVGLWACLRWRTRPASGFFAPVFLIMVSIVVWLVGCHELEKVRWEQLQRRFQNIAIARIFGSLYYHAYDSYEYGRMALGLEGGRKFDMPMVKALIAKSRQQSMAATPFAGMFEGRDFLLIQLESLEYFAVDAEVHGRPVMPFMQKLFKLGYGFRLFDQTHLGRSADGQFIYLNSLHPPAERPLAFAYPNNTFFSLPAMFRERGYQTVYVHPSDPSFWNAKQMAIAYGFETLLFACDFPLRDKAREFRGWGISDEALFQRLVGYCRENTKPAFYYVVTLMCHHPYPETPLEDTDFPPSRPESMVRRYLRCCSARDKAIEKLVDDLGQTERGRRTVLCLVGDHDSNVTDSEKRHLHLPSYPDSEAVPMVMFTVESVLSGKPMLKKNERPPVRFGAQMDLAPSIGHVFSLAMEQSVFLGWNLFTKQDSGTRISRLGTWMDRRGMIKPPEDHSEVLDTKEFEVSEMLLQGDRIDEIRRSP